MNKEFSLLRPYCGECGDRLTLISWNECGFSIVGGEPLYHFTFCCDKRKHWWDGHSLFSMKLTADGR